MAVRHATSQEGLGSMELINEIQVTDMQDLR
jgi:hypothetical protein